MLFNRFHDALTHQACKSGALERLIFNSKSEQTYLIPQIDL